MPRTFDIGPHFESLIDTLVASGRYPDPDVAIRVALSLLEEAEGERARKVTELRQLIQEGLDSGPPEEWDLEETRRRLHTARDARRRAAE